MTVLFLIGQLFNLLQLFKYTPYLFYKKRFKSEINSFCIWTLSLAQVVYPFESYFCDIFIC
jgi:hypothetical protein